MSARDRTGSLSKLACRCCQREINRQSYAEHLKAKHPKEDSKDLRPHGQRCLFTQMKKRKVEEEKEMDEVKEDQLKTDDQNNEEIN